MKNFFLLLAFLLSLMIAIFSVQNSSVEPVEVHFLFWGFKSSVVIIIFCSLGIGLAIAALLNLFQEIKNRRKIKGLTGNIKKLEERLAEKGKNGEEREEGGEKETSADASGDQRDD